MAAVTETVPPQIALGERITRFDIHQIVQHAGLMGSFILLVVTGLPLKFNTWGVSQWWAGVWGGIDVIRSVHHFAAWMIVIVSLYHLLYIAYSTIVLKRPFPVRMIPSLQDIRNFIHEMGYFLGMKKNRPRIDRFNWKEKFDYWAIFWGMPVMALSGFIMMYPVFVTRFLPGWAVPAALVAHSDEAMLALIWIFMVHIFFSHFTPGVFPLNTSIFSGKVSQERYQQEHPLEYERLLGVTAQDEPPGEERTAETREQLEHADKTEKEET